MDPVRAQYEAYPYPERKPEDERRRLVTGSPSDPPEMDHFLWSGRRDWSQPFRALVAGGGTGDGLIQLAQRLSDAKCPAEITYLDLSTASRAVAEARAAVRGLSGIRFVTGDLLSAPDLGRFDYIDCCGVLHHLPDPDAGFAALSAALAPDGGMGLMVYAPFGRDGVYPVQDAFRTLFAADAPAEKLRLARAAMAVLPGTNALARNPFVGDHREGDAGLYDLLLHSRDRPYAIGELAAALERAGLALVSPVEPGRYDPLRCLPDEPAFRERVAALSPVERMGLAERLAGDLKVHVVYAVPKGREGAAEAGIRPDAVPRLNGLPAQALARQVAKLGEISVEYPGRVHRVALPRSSAPLIARIDGRAPLSAIAQGAGLDWFAFQSVWGPLERGLRAFNRLHYTRFPA